MRFLVLLLMAIPCWGQEAPKPNGKVFWVESTVLAGSSAFDWKTTSDFRQDGWHEINASWAIGRGPDTHKIVLYGVITTGAEIWALRKTERSRNRWLKWAMRGWIAYETEEHVRWGVSNRGLHAHH